MLDKGLMEDLYAIEEAPDDPMGYAKWLINDALSSWSEFGFGNWAICPKSSDLGLTDRVIGFAGFAAEGLQLDDPEEALEVSWGIHPQFSGQGLATEACVAVFAFGFDVIKAGKIIALTSLENWPSRRLMERLGMIRSRIAKPYDYDECVLYTVSVAEWRGSAPAP